MNLYGCIPASYFPAHSTLTYWAQAASLAGLPTSESAFTSATLALSLKKAQPRLSLNDVIQKSRSVVSLRSPDHLPSSFRLTPRDTPPPCDTAVSLSHHGHIQFHTHLHQGHRQQQQNHHHLQHRPFSTSPPPVGNGLAPLQALCDSDVSAFTAKTSAVSGGAVPTNDGKGSLKFGMSRILSDDFGKTKNEKENSFQLSNVPESCRSLPLCPCNSATCTAYTHPSSPYPRGPLPSLSAVHALQPPNYPLSSSADALPGPYSILSTDSSSTNQPKRKRSWSRAVFSNLQRKGLEKRFEVQKYVTKPDRRQLAAMLGLTDAQVKVWFQNRRMKWRHAQQQGEKDKQIQQQQDEQTQQQSSQQIKKDDVNVDRDSSKTSLSTGSGFTINDVNSHSTSSHNAPGLASPVLPTEKLTTKIDENLISGCSTSRETNSHSYPPRLIPGHRTNTVVPCETRTGHSFKSSQCHGIGEMLVSHDVASRSDDDMISPLRNQVRSPSSGVDDTFDDVAIERLMDSDEDSRSCLEIDSDVDVNGDDDEDEIPDNMKNVGAKIGEQDSGHFDADISMKEIDVDN